LQQKGRGIKIPEKYQKVGRYKSPGIARTNKNRRRDTMSHNVYFATLNCTAKLIRCMAPAGEFTCT
jgi:hypothetical protein